MTDAVIFLAIVLLTIASFTNSLLKGSFLVLSCLYGFFRIVILAADTLTNTRLACICTPSADAIELATLATLAVTVQLCARFCRIIPFRRCTISGSCWIRLLWTDSLVANFHLGCSRWWILLGHGLLHHHFTVCFRIILWLIDDDSSELRCRHGLMRFRATITSSKLGDR